MNNTNDTKTGLASLLKGTTPGPWAVGVFLGDGPNDPRLGIYAQDQTKLACIEAWRGDCEIQAEANARLIAAAPALAASHAELVAALADTEETALELMLRSERIDAMLAEAHGVARNCELGQIARMRSQLSRNRQALSTARQLTQG